MKIQNKVAFHLGEFLKKVTDKNLISKTLGAYYACLDFYAMMQQVSYLKQFSI